MDPIELFLRYAYSCGEVKRDYLSQISDEDLDRVKEMILDGRADEAFAREKFPVAFVRAKRMLGIEEFETIEDVDTYFLFAHNEAIDLRDGNYARLPETLCEYCKAHVVEVTNRDEIKGQILYRFRPYEKVTINQQAVHGLLVPNANPGELIVIHQGMAVKKISEDYYGLLKSAYTKLGR